MRVGRTHNQRYRHLGDTWRPHWKFKKGHRRSIASYEKDDAPDYFSLGDFPDLDADEWVEIETWCAGGLGLFRERAEPLGTVFSDHRVGLEFENESRDMAATAVPVLTAMFDGVTYHREFPYGWKLYDRAQGLTDVVVCAFDWPLYRRRQRIVGQSTLNDRWGYLKCYRAIREDGPFTASDWLTEGPYKTKRYLKEIWNFLTQNGYLASNGAFGSFWTVMPLPDHMAEVHAIELKQSNWKEALGQAEQAYYADYRWVALDAGHMKAAMENRDAFSEAGVGLIAIARGAAIQIVPSERQEPDLLSLDREDLRERSVAQLTPDVIEEAEPKPEPDEEEERDEEEAWLADQAALGDFSGAESG